MNRRIHFVTGGQTGVDRACLDFAIEALLPVSGWCPKGRMAEDGVIASRYPLQETPGDAVEIRTEWNARDSDGTVIFAFGPLSGGTLFTEACAKKYERPYFVLDLLAERIDRELFWIWFDRSSIRILNVAGPRESHLPGEVYSKSLKALKFLFDVR